MSGDVQPRKRKDKKRKKDELGVDEAPRGTAAALGEGDVFMHSPNEHGTGGHWCAKIIFFSLLAVLVTLIGLIILENRGLTELEANSVESQYSGILEGWLEDAPEDDHHDEHTLELKHHDEEEEHEDEEEDLEVEVERLEKEVSDDDLSEELPAPELDDDDKSEEISNEIAQEDDADADDGATEDEEFLEPDDIDDALPEIEPIVAPKGKPLVEVEEETPIVKPADTLAEEEEYEKQQEELRREQEQASHKDGGNSIEDDWPGEPSDQYWRQQLDQAEEELRQEWLD